MIFLVLNNHGYGGAMKTNATLVEAETTRDAVVKATKYKETLMCSRGFSEVPYAVVSSQPPPMLGGEIWVEVIGQEAKDFPHW